MTDSRATAFFKGAGRRIANGAIPGNVFDSRSNYMGNGGRAAVATALKFAAGLFGGAPAAQLADRGLSGWVTRGADYGISRVQPESVPIYGAPPSAQSAFVAAPPSATPNLGFPSQSPGGMWNGFLQGQGSVNNFGNTQFGNGMASVGQWSPQSAWGQQVAAPTGSNLALGNNVGNFLGGGSGGGSRGGGQSFGSSMPGIMGGRFAGGNAANYKRSFITTNPV
ncbi:MULTISPECIES: hypothetical protein [Stenotrophomonas]|uniref:hypothetical protein n=1 Tax=Stenotrophomonas TaxID=40323 RepID=UPI000B67C51F|nr:MULTISPECIES: hypothetical protein [Stenotrophomonas]SMR76407.1 hypothetical protein SAMN04487863_2085 [Stenotrophomonas sp. yr243]SNS68419.1 hypothetical protein SAMN05518671_1556 [Stenotrophomonas lactitubi]